MLIKLFGCKEKEENNFNNKREENDEDEETISLNPWFYEEDEEFENDYKAKQITPFTLAAIVFIYLVSFFFIF
jgi:hypothetical protein